MSQPSSTNRVGPPGVPLLECAVISVPDAQWGERIVVAVVFEPASSLTLDALRTWGRERLATYKLPSRLEGFEQLPRNAMGKVVKPKLAQWVAERSRPQAEPS